MARQTPNERQTLVTIKHPILAAVAALTLAAAAHGQGIERKSEAFHVDQVLPLAAPPAAATDTAVAPVIAAPQAAAPMAAAPEQQWSIEPTDLRLADTLARWAKQAGIQFRWDAPRHMELGASNTYSGSVYSAFEQVLASDSIQASEMPLEVCFYPNTPVLARVTRRGEQAAECPSLQAPAWVR